MEATILAQQLRERGRRVVVGGEWLFALFSHEKKGGGRGAWPAGLEIRGRGSLMWGHGWGLRSAAFFWGGRGEERVTACSVRAAPPSSDHPARTEGGRDLGMSGEKGRGECVVEGRGGAQAALALALASRCTKLLRFTIGESRRRTTAHAPRSVVK